MIQDYEPWVILAWLSRSEHDTLLKSVAPYAIRQVYFLLFYAALVKLAHWHHPLGIKLPVNFVFAQQGTMGDQAAMWFSYVRRLKKPGIRELLGSSPVFEDDKLVAPRQAADMVAWHMRRRKDHPSKLDSNWPTATLSELLRAESHLQKEALQSAAEQMKKVPGFALVQGKPSKEFKTRLEEVVRNLKLSYLRQRLHEVLRAMDTFTRGEIVMAQKVIKIVGTSKESFAKAAANAVAEAAKGVRNLKWARVAGLEMELDGKNITQYRTTTNIYFDIEE